MPCISGRNGAISRRACAIAAHAVSSHAFVIAVCYELRGGGGLVSVRRFRRASVAAREGTGSPYERS